MVKPPRDDDISLFGDLDAPPHPLDLERQLWESGMAQVAGVDEAGRGPLAGPVVAAAVILEPDCPYPGVDDSKKLRPEERERAFTYICRRARAVRVGLVGQVDIDRINILQASLTAMARAVADLQPTPDYLLVDGNFPVPLDMPQRAVPHGDALSLSIAAASIVAKVLRDRIMTAYDRKYPEYGFAAHKGYGTKAHRQALAAHGPCALHRRSFRGVRSDQDRNDRGTRLIG